eukprot:1060144-Rhodomonas_salina.1
MPALAQRAHVGDHHIGVAGKDVGGRAQDAVQVGGILEAENKYDLDFAVGADGLERAGVEVRVDVEVLGRAPRAAGELLREQAERRVDVQLFAVDRELGGELEVGLRAEVSVPVIPVLAPAAVARPLAPREAQRVLLPHQDTYHISTCLSLSLSLSLAFERGQARDGHRDGKPKDERHSRRRRCRSSRSIGGSRTACAGCCRRGAAPAGKVVRERLGVEAAVRLVAVRVAEERAPQRQARQELQPRVGDLLGRHCGHRVDGAVADVEPVGAVRPDRAADAEARVQARVVHVARDQLPVAADRLRIRVAPVCGVAPVEEGLEEGRVLVVVHDLLQVPAHRVQVLEVEDEALVASLVAVVDGA